MEYNRDELKKLYENTMLNCNDNGAIIINYATLCSTKDEYTKAIRYLKNLANNIDNYRFHCDGILSEKYPSTIPLFFWKYLTVLLIQNLSSKLIEENDIFTNEYDLDINYLLPIVMNVMHLYDDGSFKPENAVTKAEFVKIAVSIIQELSISLEKIEHLKDIDEFKDARGHWCEAYIKIASRIGILDLNNEKLFYPDKTIIVAEAVEILRKIIYLDKTRKYHASVNKEFYDDRLIFKYEQQILKSSVTRKIASQLIEDFFTVYYNNLLINKQKNEFLINPSVQVLVFILKMYEDNNCLKSSLLLMNVLYENFLEEFKKIEPEKAYIYSLIINLPDKQKLIVYRHLSKISSSIIKIKESLFVNTNKKIKIVHYTSLQALKALTMNDDKDKLKFRLSNVEYLNDPSEGTLFKELLKKHWERYGFIKKMDCLKEVTNKSCMINNTYIASFIDNDDNLPLWIHYGDRAEGCSIIFNKDLFSNKNTLFLDQMSGKYSLYKVLYISKDIEDIGKSDIKQLNSIRKELNDCYIKEDANCQQIVFSFADMMVEQIAYLFKDKSYQYENEMRIIGFSQLHDAKSFYYGNEVFPRIVLEMEQSINIDEIVFGPKVTRVNEKALALLKFKAVTDISKIRKSEIEYK